MRKLASITVAGVACWLVAAGAARGQGYTPYWGGSPADLYNRTSNVSPYLNMLRGGSPAANYFTGVVPQFQQRNFNAQAATEIDDLFRQNARLSAVDDPILGLPLIRRLPQTGHPTGFQTYGTYFTPQPR